MIQRIAMHYKQLQDEHALFSVFDETFYKKYRASIYPCFFVSEYEVALYNMLCTYCFDITNGNTAYIPYCFESVQSLMSYTYEHAATIDHISPRFFDIVYSLFTSAPFLPLIDTYAQRFIPKHTNHNNVSSFDDKALIKLSAAVSIKYIKNNIDMLVKINR